MNRVPFGGWVAFGILVLILLAIDLFSHRGKHGQGAKAAYIWSGIWIAAGLLFVIFVWMVLGARAGHEYDYGLAGVLAFAAVKMIADRWIHIHPLAAVGITAAIIGGAVWASVRGRKRK
jgi:hypothetical protein